MARYRQVLQLFTILLIDQMICVKSVHLESGSMAPLYLTEEQVLQALNWPDLLNMTQQAFEAVSADACAADSGDLCAVQPQRLLTALPQRRGILFTMPAYLQGLAIGTGAANVLSCKLVTSFQANAKLTPPLPNILATILLFDDTTGKLKCILEGTTLTAWRTAAGSVVATNQLRKSKPIQNKVLAVLGAGAQGRIHAIAFQNCIGFDEIRIWNHTPQRGQALVRELQESLNTTVRFFPSNEECVRDADVIVTATYAPEPIVQYSWVKDGAHINAVGAGANHHSELSPELYRGSAVYADSWSNVRSELAGLRDLNVSVVAEIGEVISGKSPPPTAGITVFHTLGMAVQDGAAAKLVYDLHLQKTSAE